jgi:hypothetical protein
MYYVADATVPGIYHRAFAAVDVGGLGEVSVNALSRVLTTSSLPAATVDKVRPPSIWQTSVDWIRRWGVVDRQLG